MNGENIMPIWRNISNADLYLPRENGLCPDLKIGPSLTFHGSNAFYLKYATEKLIQITTDGYEDTGVVSTGPDAITFDIEGSIDRDNLTATAADAAINSLVTAGNAYSAFGKVIWDDVNGTDWEMFFAVTGDGDHGAASEAVFTLTAPAGGEASTPQIAGSRIDCLAGKIKFSMTGASTNPRIEVLYEMSREGERQVNYINNLLEHPNLASSYVYVTAAEDGSEYYVTGSAGSIKTEKVFSVGSKVGDRAKKITYYYQDVSYPSKPTKKFEELDFVVAADLI